MMANPADLPMGSVQYTHAVFAVIAAAQRLAIAQMAYGALDTPGALNESVFALSGLMAAVERMNHLVPSIDPNVIHASFRWLCVPGHLEPAALLEELRTTMKVNDIQEMRYWARIVGDRT